MSLDHQRASTLLLLRVHTCCPLRRQYIPNTRSPNPLLPSYKSCSPSSYALNIPFLPVISVGALSLYSHRKLPALTPIVLPSHLIIAARWLHASYQPADPSRPLKTRSWPLPLCLPFHEQLMYKWRCIVHTLEKYRYFFVQWMKSCLSFNFFFHMLCWLIEKQNREREKKYWNVAVLCFTLVRVSLTTKGHTKVQRMEKQLANSLTVCLCSY